jgi:hypothetical protein
LIAPPAKVSPCKVSDCADEEPVMKKSRFTEEQNIGILQEADTRMTVAD